MNANELFKNRRTYYDISNESPVSNEQIKDILRKIITHVPSAFNSQSTRLVLLLGQNHIQLWNIVKDTLQKRITSEQFVKTEKKINHSFASGYGTVLFFEDSLVVEKMQEQFPTYKDNFPKWSEHTNAMHQLAMWLILEEAGFGASLQHYNPLIDDEVRRTFQLPDSWQLIAQMPFGKPIQEPLPKEFQDVESRIRIFE